MSSSDDDVPLVKGSSTNGVRSISNGVKPKSLATIPKSVDKAMDKAIPSNGHLEPGLSIRNGPLEEMEVDDEAPVPNGGVNGHVIGKRKSRQSLPNGRSYKEASSGSEDDAKPLSKRRRVTNGKAKQTVDSDSDDTPLMPTLQKSSSSHTVLRKPPKASETAIGESEDSDVPLEAKLVREKKKIEKRAEKEAKAMRKEEKEKGASARAPKAKVKREIDSPNATPKKKQPAKKQKAEESEDDDAPLAGKSKAKRAKVEGKKPSATPSKRPTKSVKREAIEVDEAAQDEEDEYRWWEDPTKGDGTTKWTTLEHNGVVFPPPYEPLPKNVKLVYDGVQVTMAPEAEEVAGFFGSMLNSTHNVENPTFTKNFFNDFTEILKETGGAKDRDGSKVKINDFKKCDFKPMFDYYQAKSEQKKSLSTAQKKEIKAQKDAAEEQYLYCTWDGRKQKVGNFRVEPPSLFRGRGEHPKTGRVKKRVKPEQITINTGQEAMVPAPPEGHRWKEIKHDQQGTWLAMWQENINGAYKYVMLAANSDVKTQSDWKKFEKARELKKYIDIIRKDYERDMKAEKMGDRQRATAMYLIDKFALRAGNEKGDDEADTVGCCSLKFEHIKLEPPNKVIFDFLGKDSIRFYNEVTVDLQVFKNLRIFKKAPKGPGDEIFDRLTTSGLNKHLSGYMTGLTAKVFRTYNASWTMAELLRDLKVSGSNAEKFKAYNDANRTVAILCNHKRTVGAAHDTQMEKMGDRIKGLKYQKWRLKQMMLDLNPKLKKKNGAEFFALDEDLDEEWVQQHQNYLVEELRTKIEKKFAKENEKLLAEGEKEMKAKDLTGRLDTVDELEQKFAKENKTKKIEAEGKAPTVEKLESSCEKLDQRIATMALQAEDKESNKEVALGTSKINYIDPRLTVVFCKKFNFPIEKIFAKTLREKFEWAMKSVDEDWEF